MMKKITYIVSIPESVGAFLKERILFLKSQFKVEVICSPGNQNEQFRALGINVIEIPIFRRLSPLKDIVSVWRLWKYLRKSKPDIVHTMTPKAGLLGNMAAWLSKVPIRIAMFNGELALPNPIVRAIVKITNALTCWFATHLNADGQGTKRYVENQHITHKPIEVFWNGNINGIDLNKFQPHGHRENIRNSLSIQNEDTVYMFVGRIVHDKGIDELIPAFCKLANLHENVHLVLVGGEEKDIDPIRSDNESLIQKHARIHAVGRQNNVSDWLEAADIFVLPSHREGCNCALLEAGAMSLPCIASDIGGCRDSITHNHNGLLFEVKNVSRLYEAMQELYMNTAMRNRMAKAGRENVLNNFDRKDVWREMLMFYNRVV